MAYNMPDDCNECPTCGDPYFGSGGCDNCVNERAHELEDLMGYVADEVRGATKNWPPFNSAHEGYGVLLEEMDELWDHVKLNQKKRDLGAMQAEAIQVAAMAIRFALEVCDEKRGRK